MNLDVYILFLLIFLLIKFSKYRAIKLKVKLKICMVVSFVNTNKNIYFCYLNKNNTSTSRCAKFQMIKNILLVHKF